MRGEAVARNENATKNRGRDRRRWKVDMIKALEKGCYEYFTCHHFVINSHKVYGSRGYSL